MPHDPAADPFAGLQPHLAGRLIDPPDRGEDLQLTLVVHQRDYAALEGALDALDRAFQNCFKLQGGTDIAAKLGQELLLGEQARGAGGQPRVFEPKRRLPGNHLQDLDIGQLKRSRRLRRLDINRAEQPIAATA